MSSSKSGTATSKQLCFPTWTPIVKNQAFTKSWWRWIVNSKSRSSRTRWNTMFACFHFPWKMSSDVDRVSKITASWQLNFKGDTKMDLITEISWNKDLHSVQFSNCFSFCSCMTRYRVEKCQEFCFKINWKRILSSQKTSLKRRSTSKSKRERKARSFIIILITCNSGRLIILMTSHKSRSSND